MQYAGGGWTGDIHIIDWQEVEQAERKTDIHIKRLKADEVELVEIQKQIFFPVKTGRLVMPEDPPSSRHRRSVTVLTEPERHSEPRAEDESRSPSNTPLMLQDQQEPPEENEVQQANFRKTNLTTIGFCTTICW